VTGANKRTEGPTSGRKGLESAEGEGGEVGDGSVVGRLTHSSSSSPSSPSSYGNLRVGAAARVRLVVLPELVAPAALLLAYHARGSGRAGWERAHEMAGSTHAVVRCKSNQISRAGWEVGPALWKPPALAPAATIHPALRTRPSTHRASSVRTVREEARGVASMAPSTSAAGACGPSSGSGRRCRHSCGPAQSHVTCTEVIKKGRHACWNTPMRMNLDRGFGERRYRHSCIPAQGP
jgi:hypothetical protein